MEIRTATRDDHPVIAKIWHASAKSMDGGAPNLDSQDRLLERIASSLAAGWTLDVALINGAIAGFLATYPPAKILDQVFVLPHAQGAGVGAALLNHAKQHLGLGFTLRTPVTNLAAQRFYERHGLRAIRDEPHPVSGRMMRYLEWQP